MSKPVLWGDSWAHGSAGPVAGQDCEEPETGPAVALLWQGLMVLGTNMGSQAMESPGEPGRDSQGMVVPWGC